jgi:threonine/homoserine/homoserine lactone efflux protein
VLSTTLAFAVVAALLTITPGADTALVLRAAVSSGPRAAVLAGAGVSLGILAWGAAAGLGLAALVTRAPHLYDALRLAGAAYLLWLGVRTWRDAGHADPAGPASGWFRSGLVTNLLNPKVGAFYLSLLPQFLPAGASTVGTSLVLAGTHAVEELAWCGLLATATVRLRRLLDKERVRRAVGRMTATVLVGFSVRLALQSR